MLSTGSAGVVRDLRHEDVPNQYQLLHLHVGGITAARRAYRHPDKRFIGDTGVSTDGNEWCVAHKWPEARIPARFLKQVDADLDEASAAVLSYHSFLLKMRGQVSATELPAPEGELRISSASSLVDLFVPPLVGLDEETQKKSMEQARLPRGGQGRRGNPDPDMDLLAHARRRPELTVEDVLSFNSKPWLCAIGGPGSGKSFMTRWLALVLAGTGPAVPQRLRGLVPIRVELRRFSERLRNSPRPSYGLLDYVDEEHEVRQVALRGTVLRTLHKSRRLYFILDGLDEVDTSVRQHTWEILLSEIALQGTRGLLTARPLGTADLRGAIARSTVLEVTLLPFGEGQISEGIERFFSNYFHSAPEEGRRRRTRFLGELAIHDSLRELCSTPLLLRLLMELATPGPLPRQRHTLFRRAVEMLAERWEMHKTGLSSGVEPLLLQQKVDFLRFLALNSAPDPVASMSTSIDEISLRRASEAFVREYGLASASDASAKSEAIVLSIRRRDHVLVALGADKYRFAHRSLQEFLIADSYLRKYHVEKLSEADLCQLFSRNWQSTAWREILLLLSGELLECAPSVLVRSLRSIVTHEATVEPTALLGYVLFCLHCLGQGPASRSDAVDEFLDALQALIQHLAETAWNLPSALAIQATLLESLFAMDDNSRASGLIPTLRWFGARWPNSDEWRTWALRSPTNEYPYTAAWRCALAALPEPARVELARDLLGQTKDQFLIADVWTELACSGMRLETADLGRPMPVWLHGRPAVVDRALSTGSDPWLDRLSRHGDLALPFDSPVSIESFKPVMDVLAIASQAPSQHRTSELADIAANRKNSLAVRLLAAEHGGVLLRPHLMRWARRAADPRVRRRAQSALRTPTLLDQLSNGDSGEGSAC